MIRNLVVLSIVLFAFLSACKQSGSEKLNGLHKFYYPEGQLYLEVNYKDSIPHGTFKKYYKNGTLQEESEYINGTMHGLSKRFYDDGKLQLETPYDSGRIHGVQKKFRQDGTKAFEAPYHYDKPCVGLKEYFTSGNLRDDFPTIQVSVDDRLFKNNVYALNLSMSNNTKRVDFYKGSLKEGKCIDDNAEPILTKEGIGTINYVLASGKSINEEINIVAKVKTELGNYYITELPYKVSVRNKY